MGSLLITAASLSLALLNSCHLIDSCKRKNRENKKQNKKLTRRRSADRLQIIQCLGKEGLIPELKEDVAQSRFHVHQTERDYACKDTSKTYCVATALK